MSLDFAAFFFAGFKLTFGLDFVVVFFSSNLTSRPKYSRASFSEVSRIQFSSSSIK